MVLRALPRPRGVRNGRATPPSTVQLTGVDPLAVDRNRERRRTKTRTPGLVNPSTPLFRFLGQHDPPVVIRRLLGGLEARLSTAPTSDQPTPSFTTLNFPLASIARITPICTLNPSNHIAYGLRRVGS